MKPVRNLRNEHTFSILSAIIRGYKIPSRECQLRETEDSPNER